ncbi:mitochondrial Exonuclease Endonuclease Phosphatase (EEP) superfamily protein [Andalucia godoyi]|uniref:Mitochondrial Exonuclease Endonuclease Phosphatase (EEP) superfamily protein n=1 Tax=Andalucia godoyi TaxID=505711 RepID=A0A8K0AG91_ANDGO|nr:mitochondrial Exonuclease Endonuclease Phosphatase (EEP) superfamily protein [Andalucia godoyi]|eukprot:ANDGO_08338.mRNA.1 mitochondrial Exonuclease Endonuclease Phosphatase (EEP) superfamily protein
MSSANELPCRRPMSGRQMVCMTWAAPASLTAMDTAQSTTVGKTMRIVSYNILAQSLVKHGPFQHVRHHLRALKHRVASLVSELSSYDADVLCLQEDDMSDSMSRLLSCVDTGSGTSRSYTIVNSHRPRKADGCSIYYDDTRFSLASAFSLSFDMIAPYVVQACRPKYIRHNIGLGVVLKEEASGCLMLVANCHIQWSPALTEVKLAQVVWMATVVQQLANEVYHCPVLWAGDFNSLPNSSVYSFLASSGVSLRGFPEFEKYLSLDFAIEHRALHAAEAPFLPHPPFAADIRSVGLRSAMSAYRTVSSPLLLPQSRSNLPPRYHMNHILSRETAAKEHARLGDNEPEYTNFSSDFVGTLDYIWVSPANVSVCAVAELLPEAFIKLHTALPLPQFSSDHLALVADVRIHW